MKKLLLVAIIGGVLVVSCEKKAESVDANTTKVEAQAIEENVQESVDPATAPVLSLEQETYDLGEVKAGEKVTKKISFTNTGKSPLQIKEANASCGCTVPSFSKEPIAPGETGELEVTYTAPNSNGTQMKTVTLITNTVNGAEEFKITANVVGAVEENTNAPVPNLN